MLQHTEVLRRSDRRRSERLKVIPCAYLADEVSALGAGILAMAAIEAHAPHTPTGPDVATSAKAMAQFGQTIEPNPQMHARYQPIAAIQSQLYQQLRQINANLDQLRTNQNA